MKATLVNLARLLGRSKSRQEQEKWVVTCILKRVEPFGTVVVETSSNHAAGDRAEALRLGAREALRRRPGYKVKQATAYVPFSGEKMS